MKIIFNNEITELPSDFTSVSELLLIKGIKPQGTAVAINDRIVKKNDWETTYFNDLDRVTVISAAFGG